MTNPFQTREPNIIGNSLIRTPQQEAYAALAEFTRDAGADEREVGIVLPVGCGKSGCITIAPFAFKARRTLVVAPGLNIAQQLHDDFDPSRSDMFYAKCGVLAGQPYPEPVEIRGTISNLGDLQEADVVITNIQQLQGDGNRWLTPCCCTEPVGVAGGLVATHMGSPFTALEPLCRAVQTPCRSPPPHPQATISGHELGGI
jgi:hypothetical protein